MINALDVTNTHLSRELSIIRWLRESVGPAYQAAATSRARGANAEAKQQENEAEVMRALLARLVEETHTPVSIKRTVTLTVIAA